MTIAARNRFLRTWLILASIMMALACVGAVLIISGGSLPNGAPGRRPMPLLDKFSLTPYSALASTLAIVVFPVFSVITLGFILFAFEKTQTIELTFFAATAFAIALESFRILIPLWELWIGTTGYSVGISRVALFGRLFAMLTLLAGIIFVTGDNAQQTGPAVFILAFFAFTLARAIPVNSTDLSSNFFVRNGYATAIETFLWALGALSVVGYLMQGLTRGTPEYVRSAGGLAGFALGYVTLLACDSWFMLALGLLFLMTGTRLFLKSLHSLYLWQ